MELGMIGLGKMGAFMTERLVRGGHRVVWHSTAILAAVKRVADKGARQESIRFDKVGRATESAEEPFGLMVPSGRAGGPDDRFADASYGAGRYDH